MSATTNALGDLERQMDEELKALGLTPDPKTEPEPKDESADRLKALETELAALKISRREPEVRYVDDQNRLKDTVTQPVGEAFKPRKMSTEAWAKIAQDDPVKANIEALNAYLGLAEGSNPFATLVIPLATKVQEHDTAIRTAADRQAEDRIYREADQFMKATPGYEASVENSEVLTTYLKNYNLPATAANFKLVYTQAVADGELTPQKQRGPRQQSPDDGIDELVEQPRTKARVPSLRQRGASASEPDYQSLIDKLERMPHDQAKRYYDKITALS